MKIAICEDEQLYIKGLENAIQAWKEKKNIVDVGIAVYLSAEDLLDDWEKGILFDVLFLDIEFRYMSGYELAKIIRSKDSHIPIVFVTNSDKYILKGYTVEALRYIKKPILQQDIDECLDKCFSFLNASEGASFIVKRKGYSLRIPYREVLYIEAGLHSVTIYMTSGQEHLMPLKTSFEEFATKFPSEYFIRCHRGYIVNLQNVIKMTMNDIYLLGDKKIAIGRNYKECTHKAFHRYFMNEAHI